MKIPQDSVLLKFSKRDHIFNPSYRGRVQRLHNILYRCGEHFSVVILDLKLVPFIFLNFYSYRNIEFRFPRSFQPDIVLEYEIGK